MIDSLTKAYHSDLLSGHFGFLRTYLKLKNKFWWPSMKNSVVRYVKARLPPDKPADAYVFHRPADYYSQLKKSLSIMHQSIRTRVVSSQAQYKQRCDHHRLDLQYELNDQVLTRVQGTCSELDPRYSLVLKSVVRKQHPIYCIKDNVNQVITRNHANDIQPIFILPTRGRALSQ